MNKEKVKCIMDFIGEPYNLDAVMFSVRQEPWRWFGKLWKLVNGTNVPWQCMCVANDSRCKMCIPNLLVDPEAFTNYLYEFLKRSLPDE